MRRILLVFTVLALVVAACGDGGEGGGDGEGGGTEQINLIVNPWTASRLNAEVAKNIIENELGNPVEIVEVNENDAMFTGMADGSLDAVLEIWPSGVTEAETASLLGALPRSGLAISHGPGLLPEVGQIINVVPVSLG